MGEEAEAVVGRDGGEGGVAVREEFVGGAQIILDFPAEQTNVFIRASKIP